MIYGISKIRNEEAIIKSTLDNWSQWVDEFYLVDEQSTDRTVEICKAHPKVKEIYVKSYVDEDRERAEWVNRQLALTLAQRRAGTGDWIVYFDADEHLYDFDIKALEGAAVACRVFDAYITADDVDKTWKAREWFGPEYRLIPFFFKNSPVLCFKEPDQRVMNFEGLLGASGDVKHYGKAISVEEFERTCDYYMGWPKYQEKWAERKGKAVHTLSDFNNKLIRWDQRGEGFPLK